MNEVNFYKKGNKHYVVMKYPDYEEEIDYEDIMNYMHKYKEYISNLCFKGNDVCLYVGKQKIRLHNYKNFKKDRDFNFIFDAIREKKFKIANKTVEKGCIIFLSALSAFVIAQYIKDCVLDIKSDKYSYENDMSNKNYHAYVDWKPEFIDVKDEVVIENQIKNQSIKENDNQNQNIEENYENKEEVNDELNCGSLVDDEKAVTTRNLYMPIIEKYCDMYNLDANLICAIATQERGVHSNTRDSSGAIGLMQIEVAIWDGQTLNVYNYMDNKYETINMSESNVKDLENNIKAGCAVFQDCLNKFNGNIYAAVQAYNMGFPTVQRLINEYANNVGKTYDEVLESNDLGWLNYRKYVGYGDSNYIENVLRYYNGNLQKAGLKIG